MGNPSVAERLSQRLRRIVQKPDSAELIRRSVCNKNFALESFLVSTLSILTQRLDIILFSWGLTVGAGAYGFYQEKQAKKLAHEMCVQASQDFLAQCTKDPSLNIKAGMFELDRIHTIADEYCVYFMHLLEDAASSLGVPVDSEYYVHEGGMRYNFARQKVSVDWDEKYSHSLGGDHFKAFLTLLFQEIKAHKNDFHPTDFILQLHRDVGNSTK